jgi:hypothetical protein
MDGSRGRGNGDWPYGSGGRRPPTDLPPPPGHMVPSYGGLPPPPGGGHLPAYGMLPPPPLAGYPQPSLGHEPPRTALPPPPHGSHGPPPLFAHELPRSSLPPPPLGGYGPPPQALPLQPEASGRGGRHDELYGGGAGAAAGGLRRESDRQEYSDDGRSGGRGFGRGEKRRYEPEPIGRGGTGGGGGGPSVKHASGPHVLNGGMYTVVTNMHAVTVAGSGRGAKAGVEDAKWWLYTGKRGTDRSRAGCTRNGGERTRT